MSSIGHTAQTDTPLAPCAFTILRPAWFTNADEIDYETTQKGEPFKGSVVSRKSVAALVVKLAESPELEVRHSLGVSKPEVS